MRIFWIFRKRRWLWCLLGVVVLGAGSATTALIVRKRRKAAKEAERAERAKPPSGELVGKRAPKFADDVEEWINGDETDFKALEGQPVMLLFWHPLDEGRSVAALPKVVALANEFESRGLVTLGFCVCDDDTEIQPLISRFGIPFRIGLDCNGDLHLSARYRGAGYRVDNKDRLTPHCFLVDGQRTVVWAGDAGDLSAAAIEEYLIAPAAAEPEAEE